MFEEEWIRSPNKRYPNASIVWKSLKLAISLVGNWLVEKFGNGSCIHSTLIHGLLVKFII